MEMDGKKSTNFACRGSLRKRPIFCESYCGERFDENGGKLHEEYPEITTYCVTADTGFEHQKPIAVAEWVKLRCAKLLDPVSVTVVRNQKRTYLEMVKQEGKFRVRSSGSAARISSEARLPSCDARVRELPPEFFQFDLGQIGFPAQRCSRYLESSIDKI